MPKFHAPCFQKNSRSALAGDRESTVAGVVIDISTMAMIFSLVFALSRQKKSIKSHKQERLTSFALLPAGFRHGRALDLE
jgi:hypothetical protein